METILLKVTSKVIEQIKRSSNQEQIAIRSTCSSFPEKLSQANKNNLVSIRLGNAFNLQIGDTGAIWRVHNEQNQQEFDRLFRFLSENPDQEIEFISSI